MEKKGEKKKKKTYIWHALFSLRGEGEKKEEEGRRKGVRVVNIVGSVKERKIKDISGGCHCCVFMGVCFLS